MKKILKNIFWFAIVLALITLLILELTGCSVIKGKRTRAVDSTHITKIDSGALKHTEAKKTEQNQWQREVFVYDTTITKPVVYIREKGNGTKTENATTNEAAWANRVDSSQLKATETVKEKKEQAFSIWQIIGIAAGAAVVVVVLSKMKIKFS